MSPTRAIAHDLNNELGVIISYAEFMSEDIEPGSRARQDLDEIRRAAERAAALTRRLLAAGREEGAPSTPGP